MYFLLRRLLPTRLYTLYTILVYNELEALAMGQTDGFVFIHYLSHVYFKLINI